MKPYYQDKWVTIYHGDCSDILPQLGKVDLVLTDPPYNVSEHGRSYGFYNTDYGNWDKGFDIQPILAMITNKIQDSCVVYIFSSQHLAGDIWKWMKSWSSFYSYLVWCKPNPMPSITKRHWNWATELICYGTRGNHIYNPLTFTANSSWQIDNKEVHANGHPTEKPESLVDRLIIASSNIAQIVLDPFLGSGTTCYCAKKLNRYSIGIEIEEKYCEIAAKRCSQEVMELNL